MVCVYALGCAASILKAQKNTFHLSLKVIISLSDCLQKFERARETDSTEFDIKFDYQTESTGPNVEQKVFANHLELLRHFSKR